ncbi:hypothetical protein KR222_010228, partial [Zaprionus bogoriensis]
KCLTNSSADPVCAKLPLLGSAWPMSILLLLYLLFVLKFGKVFMEHRQPYNLKKTLIVYNIGQVVYNSIMFGFIVYHLFIDKMYDLSCMETLPLDHPDKNIERYISYAYFINKILDLLDTIFFVLRKSYKQVTFLHVYHHILMVYFFYWVVNLYGFGAQFSVLAFLNTFVHSVMYFYYLISALKPGLSGSLWWKKYITLIQIIQFLIILLQAVYMLVFNRDCNFPLYAQILLIVQSVLMIKMFGTFYIRAYVRNKHQKRK